MIHRPVPSPVSSSQSLFRSTRASNWGRAGGGRDRDATRARAASTRAMTGAISSASFASRRPARGALARAASTRGACVRASMSKSTSTTTSTSRARLAATRRVRASSSSSASSSATSPSHDAFLGHWSRDSARNQNVVDYLVAHGVGTDALKRARASYEQTWTTSESGAEGEFQVRTTSEEVGIDRTLTYSLGEFVEKYETSAIFGAEPGEVTRVASFDAATRTHTTTTTSSIGHETTTRRVREDGKEMTCERRFVSNDAEVEVDVTCVEIFVRRET